MFTESYAVIQAQNDNAKFSGLFDNIIQGINAGLKVFSAIGGVGGSSTGGGCGISQAKGSTQIQQCSTQVLAAMDALLAQVGQQPYQQIIDTAQQLAASLSNSTYFYQAQRGDDAAILANAKSAAQQKLQQIIAAANAASHNPVSTATGQGGQIISSGGNTITTGLDTVSGLFNSPLVIYGALAVGAFILVKKATK
jgi:hypothetical protein